jgi:ribonuclease BN (tRNA processing enzyme)
MSTMVSPMIPSERGTNVTVAETEIPALTVTFAGSGDAFGSGGRNQACIHLRGSAGGGPVLLDCGATSLSALNHLGLDPGEVAAVFVSHLHGDHFGGLPFLILDGQFSRRVKPLTVVGPPGLTRRLTDAMECMFPGSSTTSRRFELDTVELAPGSTRKVSGVAVSAWEADHPSGAPALILRLELASRTLAYTGDTAWTDAIAAAATDADLLIAEAYFRDKDIPYHLRLADLEAHRDQLTARRVIVTHMSADVLDHRRQLSFEAAHDGLVVRL